MQLDLQLGAPPARAAEQARELARVADGVFTFEGQHDVFLPLAMAAGTTDLRLMTNIAVAPVRSPLHLAHLAWDLQEMSSGRFHLGLGSQIKPHIESRYGGVWSRPAARMRESVLAVKEILRAWQEERRPDFRGEFSRHTLMPPTFSPGPNRFGVPPVLMGALGPVMTRTAAEVADGLLVMPFNSQRHFTERTLVTVHAALAAAGRTVADFEIVPQAMVALGDSDASVARAVDGVRKLVAFYASTPAYRPVLEVEGAEHLQPLLNERSKVGAYAEMAALVDDDLVRRIAVVGTPREVSDQLVERFGAHADRVLTYFPHYEADPTLVAELSGHLHAAPAR